MFIKNPNQKVSYSFRIKEELLENLKGYAKATNQSLPETLNNLLEESIDGVNTTNTFITELDGIIINIPLMYHTQENQPITDTVNMVTVFERGTNNYLDYETEGLTYEVKQIPNNLDIWIKTKPVTTIGDSTQPSTKYSGKGFYSRDYPKILHEGVNFVIVPELLLNPQLYITEQAITNCLKFIYFTVNLNGEVTATNISYKDCFRRLKEAGNEEVLYKFRGIDSTIYKFSLALVSEIENDPEAYTRYNNYREIAYNELIKYANRYNDNTIVSLEEGLSDKLENFTPEEAIKDLPKGLVFTSDGILTELLEENQTLQNRVNELEGKFSKLSEIMEKKIDERDILK